MQCGMLRWRKVPTQVKDNKPRLVFLMKIQTVYFPNSQVNIKYITSLSLLSSLHLPF